MPTTRVCPNFRNLDEVLCWCHKPHAQATRGDFGTVEAFMNDLIRRTAERITEYAARGEHGMVVAASAFLCEYAQAACKVVATMTDFTTVQPGLLPAGTVTDQGTIVRSTLTAYEMADGSFVPFQLVHGQPKPAQPLVVLA